MKDAEKQKLEWWHIFLVAVVFFVIGWMVHSTIEEAYVCSSSLKEVEKFCDYAVNYCNETRELLAEWEEIRYE